MRACRTRRVIALGLTIGAVGAVVLAIALLRRSGPAWRIGRLLAAAPARTLAEAIEMAERGDGAYVRVSGRIGSDEEFPDEHDQPLVFRRRRLQRAEGREWRTIGDERDAVPFWLEERGVRVAVDVDALGDGLVVVPRLAEGLASELEAGATPGTEALPPDTRLRLRIEQVSAVEHAWACGVLEGGPAGATRMTAGLGRPLVLTPLEPPVAMRVLAADSRRSVIGATGLLVAAAIAASGAVIAFVVGA
jgi:hypothetical protein